MIDSDIRVDEQAGLQAIAWAALDQAGIEGPPTDPKLIADFFGLSVREFEPSDLAADLDEPEEQIRKIRALLVPDRKLIWINRMLSRKRRRFSILHEIGHYVLPGHASEPELLRHNLPTGSSTEDELTSEFTTHALIEKEREANEFAAECLFQGNNFDEVLLDHPFGWETIKDLAKKFDASFESTARRYVERHPLNCALVIFRPTDSFLDGEQPPLTLEYTITSRGFSEKYFTILARGQLIEPGSGAHSFFYEPLTGEVMNGRFHVRRSQTGQVDEFTAEFFSNRYKLMALLEPA